MKSIATIFSIVMVIFMTGCAIPTQPVTKVDHVPFSMMLASQTELDAYKDDFKKKNEEAKRVSKKTGQPVQYVQHSGGGITYVAEYQSNILGNDGLRIDPVYCTVDSNGRYQYTWLGSNLETGENIGKVAVKGSLDVVGRYFGRSKVNTSNHGGSPGGGNTFNVRSGSTSQSESESASDVVVGD